MVEQRDEYLITEEVAELTRTTPKTVEKWRYKGTGPAGFQCGKRVLYPRTEVERWLRSLQKSA